jgi:hypothetical protein
MLGAYIWHWAVNCYCVQDMSPAYHDCVAFISAVMILDLKVNALEMGMSDRRIGGRISVGTRKFFVLRNVQNLRRTLHPVQWSPMALSLV